MAQPAANDSLVDLGRTLRRSGYAFTTITPLSHKRVLTRPMGQRATLRDIFGWSRPFRPGDLPDGMFRALDEAGCLAAVGESLHSTVRFSSLDDQLFVHSAFPTEQADSVFFGPDTYRFARAIDQVISTLTPRRSMRILDIGAGSGAGGLRAARSLQAYAPDVILTDINDQALRVCAVNSALNDVQRVQTVNSNLYRELVGTFDLIVSNPPYLIDPTARAYRHGGGEFGAGLSLRIVEEGLPHLARGCPLLLYTGTAIVEGVDRFELDLRKMLTNREVNLAYHEIDPDVFGEELETAPYDRADRIAVVAAVLRRD